MNRTFKIIFAAALAASATTALQAQSAEPRSLAVETTGLDLSSSAGRKALDLRIARAAKAVCEDTASRLDIKARRQEAACIDKATASAMRQIENRAGRSGPDLSDY